MAAKFGSAKGDGPFFPPVRWQYANEKNDIIIQDISINRLRENILFETHLGGIHYEKDTYWNCCFSCIRYAFITALLLRGRPRRHGS